MATPAQHTPHRVTTISRCRIAREETPRTNALVVKALGLWGEYCDEYRKAEPDLNRIKALSDMETDLLQQAERIEHVELAQEPGMQRKMSRKAMLEWIKHNPGYTCDEFHAATGWSRSWPSSRKPELERVRLSS